MEALNNVDLAKLCRLCMKPEGFKQPIFGIEGVHRGLSHKISVCFPFEVYETDPLPKLICHKCIYSIEKFYYFRTTVLNAFESAKKALLQRTDPEINRYFSVTGDQPVTANKDTTMQTKILNETNRSNSFSENEKESVQTGSSKTLQNTGIQTSQPSDDEMVPDSGRNSPTEATFGENSKKMDALNCLPVGETSKKDSYNNENGSDSQEENAVDEAHVITQTLFDESFTREIHNNAFVIVSKGQNVSCDNDESEASKKTFPKQMANDECTTSPVKNVAPNNEQMDAEEHTVLDSYFSNVCQDNNMETVDQTETLGATKEQPSAPGLTDGENLMNKSDTYRSENEFGTSSEISHQRQDISLKNASPRTMEMPLWCNLCLKYFKSKRQFKYHNITVHNVMKPQIYTCICKRKFDTYLDFLKHNKSHISIRADVTDIQLLECGFCHKRFYDRPIFASHLSSHKETSEKYESPKTKPSSPKTCDKSAFHKTYINSNTADLVCDLCMLTFETATALEQHLKLKVCLTQCDIPIPDEKKSPGKGTESLDKQCVSPDMQCILTGTSGVDVAPMDVAISCHGSEHVTNLPSVAEPIVKRKSIKKIHCSDCDKSFKYNYELKKHQKVHKKTKIIKLSNSLYKHSIAHVREKLQADKYQCQYCYKCFSEKRLLSSHKCKDNEHPPNNDLLRPRDKKNARNSFSTITENTNSEYRKGGYKTPEKSDFNNFTMKS